MGVMFCPILAYCRCGGERTGENLAYFSGSDVGPYKWEEAVQDWFDEKQYWDFGSKSCSFVCGHYTTVRGLKL